jgi:hypothetical protein
MDRGASWWSSESRSDAPTAHEDIASDPAPRDQDPDTVSTLAAFAAGHQANR